MNFKIAFVGAALMVFGGILAVGCGGDDCTTAADDMLAHAKSCPDYVEPTTTSSTTGTTTECTAALGTAALCTSKCYVAAPCECLALDKAKTCSTDAATAFAKCTTDCSAAK